jgi:hypothetical protein
MLNNFSHYTITLADCMSLRLAASLMDFCTFFSSRWISAHAKNQQFSHCTDRYQGYVAEFLQLTQIMQKWSLHTSCSTPHKWNQTPHTDDVQTKEANLLQTIIWGQTLQNALQSWLEGMYKFEAAAPPEDWILSDASEIVKISSNPRT